jgi:hypothetical protein
MRLPILEIVASPSKEASKWPSSYSTQSELKGGQRRPCASRGICLSHSRVLVGLQENGTRESCQVERHVPIKQFLVSAGEAFLKTAVGAVPKVHVSAGGTKFRLTAWSLTTPCATNFEPSRTVTHDHRLQRPLGCDQATPPAPAVTTFFRTLRPVQKLTIINHFFTATSNRRCLLFGRDQSRPPVSAVRTIL